MTNKEHLSIEGLHKIKNIALKMNTLRDFEDKYKHCKSFLGLNSNGQVLYTFELPEEWLQGFLDGEGMFYNYISENKISENTNPVVDSSLEIGQSSHDVAVLLAIKKSFNGGYLKPKYNVNDIYECKNSRSVNRYIFRDTNKIIQFVEKYPLLTRKHLDFLDWKKIVELKNDGAHKTLEGLDLMKHIKSKMNSMRDSE